MIRIAVSLVGECDILASTSGFAAEGVYSVPQEPKEVCHSYPDAPLLALPHQFHTKIP